MKCNDISSDYVLSARLRFSPRLKIKFDERQ